jgi:hypothetical protein
MAKPPHTSVAMRVFYPVFKWRELAAGWRYTTLGNGANGLRAQGHHGGPSVNRGWRHDSHQSLDYAIAAPQVYTCASQHSADIFFTTEIISVVKRGKKPS